MKQTFSSINCVISMSCHPIEAKLGHGTFLWHLDKSFWKYKPATNIQAKNITGWYIAVRPIAEVALLCSKSPLMFPSVCLKKCFDLWFPLFCYYKKKKNLQQLPHGNMKLVVSCIWVPGQWSLIPDSRISILWCPVREELCFLLSHGQSVTWREEWYTIPTNWKRPSDPQEDPGRCVYGTHSQFCTWGEKVVIRRGPFILGLGSPPLPHGL